MRRALLKQWPAITKFYGIRPWELDRFTASEWGEYLRQMAEFQREQRRQARRAKQR